MVLNDVAKRVIDAQRGLHDEFVFVASKGKPRKPIRYMNNTAWQQEGGAVAVARARFEAHLRPASPYCWSAAGNAQGAARAQERRHHQPLQCAGAWLCLHRLLTERHRAELINAILEALTSRFEIRCRSAQALEHKLPSIFYGTPRFIACSVLRHSI